MIVAAGLGTRMRPLSDLRPKPAVPVRGIPLVAYQLRLLARHGVHEVIINTHHLAERLIEAAERWCPPGLTLHFSHEPRLLDTGGGIRRVAGFLRESDPCLVLGGDMLLDADLSALVAWHRARSCAVTLLLRADPRSARFGSIGVDVEGRIRRIATRFDLGGEAHAGVYAWANVLSARAFDSMPQRDVFSHLDHWLAPLLAAGADDLRAQVAGPATCTWEPVGTLAEYLAVNLAPPALSYWDADAAARAAGVALGPDLVIGSGATLGPGARLRRAVVWDGERVPAGFEAEGGVFAGGRFQPCDPPSEETPREARP
jgi:NDP-sugar pyrophosphorylase family protein